jgi:LuxR family maltose regulon positive regulatory protein
MTGSAEIQVGTLLNERYHLDAELGRGGMGMIYRAHDRLLDRDVAIKVLSTAELSGESRARLLREAQAAAKLNHPNIVSIYDVGEDAKAQGASFIVMELVEGASLHERGPRALEEILSIAQHVCAALEHAHDHGIIHRDLKPENVLIGLDGSVKLMDFGLAHLAGSRLTTAGAILGTVFYLAPEQALGQEIDDRVDLYALGVMLYELTTGQLPYTGDDPLVIISQHMHAPVVRPSTHNTGIPPALDALIVQLLNKRPEDRPASATEVRQALADLAPATQANHATDPLEQESSAVAVPLLETKLYIPPMRPELVSRPRLIERLNAGLGGRLTLVSAPAGFGKTTLVSEWVQAMGEAVAPIAVAWLSLDESDNDPTRFLVYVIAALQTVAAEIGKGALSALHSPQPPPAEAVLTGLINELADISDRILLVLDDYHLIEAQPVHDVVTFLLQHLPPDPGPGVQGRGVHLVIASREDPPLPLARLRVRGQLTELRATNLRFTSAEAAEFLNQAMGLSLSAEDIAALETRTEGWIAGLQLAAVSMQGRDDIAGFIDSFTGSHRFVLDYLLEEVLEQQSESVQTFLLQTSILDRLTGLLCDALTGQGNGQATLEMLERANLFIVSLDSERRWYRYHHLFADLLRQRLRQNPPPLSSPSLEGGIVAGLHRRASAWYEQNGFADEAIEHALPAEDLERAAHLIQGIAEDIWVRGEDAKLRRWLDALPVELILSTPQLCLFHAWYLLSSGKTEMADQVLQAAELALEPSPALRRSPGAPRDRVEGSDGGAEAWPREHAQSREMNRLALRGKLATTRAFSAFYRGDIPAIIQHAREALEYLPEEDLTWRGTAIHVLGDAYDFSGQMVEAYHSRLEAVKASRSSANKVAFMIANSKLALILRRQGRLQQVQEICQQQDQLAGESGMAQTDVAGWLMAIWGEVLAEINDLDGALRKAEKGVEITERGGDLAMLGWSYLCLTRVLFSRGDLAKAEETIRRMENATRESNVPPWITNQKAAWQARVWLAQGDLAAASQWAEARGLDATTEPAYLHEMEYTVLARILSAQNQFERAVKLLQRLLEAAQAGGRTSRAIEILNLQALAVQARGDTEQAIIALEQALTLAEPGGFVRIFADEGPSMARLLCEAAARGIMPGYVGKLLAAFGDGTKDEGRMTESLPLVDRPSPALVEPLSERELEVLQLIAQGLMNREIAARLFLSLNTVKAHTRNIYGKLGVNSRTQAVVEAQRLGLIEHG